MYARILAGTSMGHMRQSHRAIRFAACILLMLVCARAGSARGRVVAIGDVHGSFPQLTKMLQQTGLIDANRRWVGGSTTLVQTGDVVDRGPRTRDCLDLLMAVEKEASRKKGKVIPLLGNHEVMDMMGDLRYVSSGDFAAFANKQSEARREEAYREFRAFVDASPRRRKSLGEDETAARLKWMQEHPVGFLEYRDAFGPRGLYGRWLRTHDTVAQVDENIFLHAGLSPQLPFRDFPEVNQRVRDEIQRFDKLWESFARKKIIWRYMTFQEASDEIRAELEARATPAQRDEQSIADKEMREFAGIGGWASLRRTAHCGTEASPSSQRSNSSHSWTHC